MKVKKIREGAILPSRMTEGAAGYDLYLPEDVVVRRGRNVLPLGIAVEIPDGYVGMIVARSGHSARGMGATRMDADIISGYVDSDYRGEIAAIVKSNESYNFCVPRGTRIAQMILVPVVYDAVEWVDNLSETERAAGGFGHSGM